MLVIYLGVSAVALLMLVIYLGVSTVALLMLEMRTFYAAAAATCTGRLQDAQSHAAASTCTGRHRMLSCIFGFCHQIIVVIFLWQQPKMCPHWADVPRVGK